ncbi:hypothetical protein LB504_000463 [Fusarium proliferatum]|nr:hypothetical protein LB504_000463 [Fusarium proliferatum]
MPSMLQNATAHPGQPVSNVAWCDLLGAASCDAMHPSEVGGRLRMDIIADLAQRKAAEVKRGARYGIGLV